MRVSADQDSPDHWGVHFSQAPHVYLNGIKQLFVLEADDTLGYVVIFRTVPGTNLAVIDGDEFATERLEGRVEIRAPGLY